MLPFIRAVFGDKVLILPGKSKHGTESDLAPEGAKTTSEGAHTGSVNSVQPCGDIHQNLAAMTEISEANQANLQFNLYFNGCQTLSYTEAKTYIADFGEMGIKASRAIANVIDALETNATITDETIATINESVIPMYTMLNTLALQKSITGGIAITGDDQIRMSKMLAVSHALYNMRNLSNLARECASTVKIFLSKVSEDAPYNINEIYAALDEQVYTVERVIHQIIQQMEEIQTDYFTFLDAHVKQLQLKIQLQSALAKTFNR
jgi:hypothetical protein